MFFPLNVIILYFYKDNIYELVMRYCISFHFIKSIDLTHILI